MSIMKTYFGLIGHPLSHSFSKTYFTEKFEREGLDCEYENYDIDDIALVRDVDLTGFNVTSPYKEAIIPYLDELDPIAAEVGAVNTVKVLPNGRLIGYNTDVIGFLSSLRALRSNAKQPEGSSTKGRKSNLNSTNSGQVGLLPPRFARGRNDEGALVLGTGGASKAVQYALRQLGIRYSIVSRSIGKGDYQYEELTPEIIQSHLLIVNATPVGMAPNINEAPNLPYDAITPQHTLIDLIYNPDETLFLHKGKEHDATTINGLTMLHAQAEASWEIWTHVIASGT